MHLTPVRFAMLRNIYLGRKPGAGGIHSPGTPGSRARVESRTCDALREAGLIAAVTESNGGGWSIHKGWKITDAGREAVEARQLQIDLVNEAKRLETVSPYSP